MKRNRKRSNAQALLVSFFGKILSLFILATIKALAYYYFFHYSDVHFFPNSTEAPKKTSEGARGVQKGIGGKPHYAVFGAEGEGQGEQPAGAAAPAEEGKATGKRKRKSKALILYIAAPAAATGGEEAAEEVPAEEPYEEAPAEEQ